MRTYNLCAVDIGNSSGRVMKAQFNGTRISFKEIHRFANDTIPMHRYLKLDFVHLLNQTIIGLAKAGNFSSLGIDTWAIDFGLLDRDDDLVLLPHHHRDKRTQYAINKFDTEKKQWAWYKETGIMFQPINTSMQLLSMTMEQRSVLDHARTFLMIPDLIHFYLTGQKIQESTNASTTQLISLKNKNWDLNIINEIGLPESIFQPIISPRNSLGKLLPSITRTYSFNHNPEVITVGSHDTASAIHAIPFSDENSLFISSGTWSLIGTILTEPLVTKKTMKMLYNNERATDGNIRFIKNCIGMWIIEELLRVWELEDKKRTSYEELLNSANKSKAFAGYLNPNLSRFYNPKNMEKEIKQFLHETGQKNLCKRSSIIRLVFEGLAFSYRKAFDDLKKITETKFSAIHIVGGGAKNTLLNQFTANACGIKVIAGPVEATAAGNVITQLEYFGKIRTRAERIEVINKSFEIKEYYPENTDIWEEQYFSYSNFFNKAHI